MSLGKYKTGQKTSVDLNMRHESKSDICNFSAADYHKTYIINSSWLTATKIWVIIDSINGLLPDDTEPLLGPMLIYHQWDSVHLSKTNFTGSDRVTNS